MNVLKRRIALGLATAAVLLSSCESRPPGKPNVILIVVDTLRADHLGSYGYGRDTSPNIDALAAESLLFENALSHAADTRFAMASLLSGFLVHETGVLESVVLSDGLELLPERLSAEGYATAAVISNWVLRSGRRYEQGFDVYDDAMEPSEESRGAPERTAGPTTDRAIDLVQQLSGGPFFLWVHYQDPHGPYTPPAGTADRFRAGGAEPRPVHPSGSLSGRGGIPDYQRLPGLTDFDEYRARYDGEIRHVDAQLQRLLDALERLGIEDETLIVLTADHGEGLGEHDYYFAHGEYLFQHQLHVPLILRWGNRLRGRRADYVRHVDILPTILAVAGAAVPPDLRGTDLRSGAETPRAILSEMRSPFVDPKEKLALTVDGMKLIFTPALRRTELYDLRRDPGELHDLSQAPDHAERLAALASGLAALRRENRLDSIEPSAPQELTDEEREKLRSLGYVE